MCIRKVNMIFFRFSVTQITAACSSITNVLISDLRLNYINYENWCVANLDFFKKIHFRIYFAICLHSMCISAVVASCLFKYFVLVNVCCLNAILEHFFFDCICPWIKGALFMLYIVTFPGPIPGNVLAHRVWRGWFSVELICISWC